VKSALATGSVWHRRSRPRPHAFRYRLYFSLLDVEGIDSIFSRSRLWSVGRFNLVSFRRSDYLGPADVPLAEAVRDRVQADAGIRPTGPIFLLTHLRQWGFCFNPVSFYFCHDQERLAFIVAEVHNTPWNERHAYVMDCRDHDGPEYRFQFDKRFHVSPFLPMKMLYDWRFRLEDQVLTVHMLVTESGAEYFAAGMTLVPHPMTAKSMRQMPISFPLVTLKVVVGIYWQAFRLWLKRIPFHSHPDKESGST
jgi:uncharacterized protein